MKPKENKKRTGALLPLSMLAVSLITTCVMVGQHMDIDSYYMIPLGREILENGIPTTNGVSYYPGMAMVAQQWLYAVITYMASEIPRNAGLMLLHLVPFAALYAACYKYERRACRDPFWAYLAATGSLLCCGIVQYQAMIRPENVTLLLVLGTCMSLEAYRASAKKAWLLLPPVLMVLEMNLHMTMWPFHFCAMAAYLVPYPEKMAVKLPFLKLPPRGAPDRYEAASVLASCAALFAQPYGLDGILYVARGMGAFSTVSVVEQQPLLLLSKQAALAVLCAVLFWNVLKNGLFELGEACLAAGFTLLATVNIHAAMFLPVALLAMTRPLLRYLESKDPASAADICPENVKKFGTAAAAAACAAAIAFCALSAPGFRSYEGMDGVAAYLDAGRPGNILAETDIGSLLYYHGFGGRIQADSRHELLDRKLNGTTDGISYIRWFSDGAEGTSGRELERRYGSLQGYLDEYDIQYIVMLEDRRTYVYLWGWLDASGGWKKTNIGPGGSWAIWERTQG